MVVVLYDAAGCSSSSGSANPVEAYCKNAIDCRRTGLQLVFPLSQVKLEEGKHGIERPRLKFKA